MRCLRRILDGDIEKLDVPGGPSGVHDFDVVHQAGSRIAVEVTACIDLTAAQFEAALNNHAIHLDVPGLRQSWEVRLHEQVRVKGVINRVVPLLMDLEARLVTGVARPGTYDHDAMVRYDGSNDNATVPKAVLALIELGVDTAWAFHRKDGVLSVEFLRRSGSAAGNTETLVTTEVERAAKDKHAALSRPTALRRDERHLFVWLEADFCGQVHFAMWSGHPAAAPVPDIPEPIDHVWVAGWSSTPGQGIGHAVIWEATRGGGWQYPVVLSGYPR
jgi:hypothetical protein